MKAITSDHSVNVKAGYYGLAVSAVYDCIESICDDEKTRSELRNIFESIDTRIAIFPASDADLFHVVQQMQNGGIIAALSGHAVRADTPGEAYAAIAREMSSHPHQPLLVIWLETIDRVMH